MGGLVGKKGRNHTTTFVGKIRKENGHTSRRVQKEIKLSYWCMREGEEPDRRKGGVSTINKIRAIS